MLSYFREAHLHTKKLILDLPRSHSLLKQWRLKRRRCPSSLTCS